LIAWTDDNPTTVRSRPQWYLW